MPAQAVKTVVKQLIDTSLKLSLTPSGGLTVAPVGCLTADLRNLNHSNKAMLIDRLTTKNGAATRATNTPVNPQGWGELATAYYAHHFNCPTCVAAKRGSRHGQSCGAVLQVLGKFAALHFWMNFKYWSTNLPSV